MVLLALAKKLVEIFSNLNIVLKNNEKNAYFRCATLDICIYIFFFGSTKTVRRLNVISPNNYPKEEVLNCNGKNGLEFILSCIKANYFKVGHLHM